MEVYERGPVKLVLADCWEWLPTLEAGSVDAVVTDPPYGVGLGRTEGAGSGHGLVREAYRGFDDTYDHFLNVIVPRINLSLDCARRGAVFSGPHIHEQRKPDAIGGVYCSAAAGRHKWGFKNFLPVLLYGTAAGLQNGARYPSAINSNATSEPSGHPCPKPIEWMEWLVNLASLEDETVCDPFTGSGTTAIACIRTGRRFIGCEISSQYWEIACARIDRELDQGRLAFDAPATTATQKTLL